jgi:DNA-binding response OmpR family regulator
MQTIGSSAALGPTKYRLLRHLMLHPGRVFSREQLLDAVWGHDIYVGRGPSTSTSAASAKR